jgi:hypothetical protein
MVLLACISVKVLVVILTSDSVGAPAPPSLALCQLEVTSQRES